METGIFFKAEPQWAEEEEEEDEEEEENGDTSHVPNGDVLTFQHAKSSDVVLPVQHVKLEVKPEISSFLELEVGEDSSDQDSMEAPDGIKDDVIPESYLNQTGFHGTGRESVEISYDNTVKSLQRPNLGKGPSYPSKPLPFQCPSCEASFQRRRELDRHQVVHTGERKFVCPICGMRFRWKTNVQRHLLVHTEMKKFKCPLCTRCFRTNGNLKEHMATHSVEKSFKCPFCEKLFGVKSNLTRHLRVHSGERNYKCSSCDKHFRTKGNLKGHLLRHSGIKSFICSTCGKAFYTNSHLRLHLESHARKENRKKARLEKAKGNEDSNKVAEGESQDPESCTEGEQIELDNSVSAKDLVQKGDLPVNLVCVKQEHEDAFNSGSGNIVRTKDCKVGKASGENIAYFRDLSQAGYSQNHVDSKPLNLACSKDISEGADLSEYLEVVIDSKPENLVR